MRNLVVLLTIAVLAATVPAAMAQQTGAVTGTVADASGALIPGVEVTATNTNTNISTSRISGEAGSYTIPALQPGPYGIVASLPGFADSAIEVNLSPNQTFRFNFVMQVAGTATQVEVISDADALLASTSSSVGDALPSYEIESLPLATRDIFDLLSTTAGVVRDNGGDGFHFAGTRNSAVNTTRDGIVASDGRYMDWNGAYAATFTSPDLVEEIQISVGTVDAAAGRGSGQVRLQTRSGTNEFHGALFYATNNSAFNANSWFNNLNGNEPNWTNRQQFGGRIGGPIIQDKAFFFLLLDEQRYRERENVTGTVWTAQARQGNFRYFPGFQNDDANGSVPSVNPDGSPVAGGPTGCAGVECTLQTINVFAVPGGNDPLRGTAISTNPFIQETLSRMPLPNNFRTGDGLNTAGYDWVRRVSGSDNAAGTSQDTNRDNLNVRFDYTINDNNKVNFVMTREHNFNDANLPSWPEGFGGESTRNPRIYTVGYTSTLSPTVVNEFRAGYRQTSWHGRPPYSLGCCFGDDTIRDVNEAGAEAQSFFSDSNGYLYIPNFATLGAHWMTEPGGTTVRSQVSPLWQFGDTISIVKGSHSFQGGWDGTWAGSNGWSTGGMEPRVALGNGAFQIDVFDDLAAGPDPIYDIANADRNFAENLLNDLSGSVSSVTQAFNVNDPAVGFVDYSTTIKRLLYFKQDDWGAFFKDTWNVSNDLTLNMGVRWDVYGVPYEASGLNVIPTDNNYLGYSLTNSPASLTSFSPVGKNSPNADLLTYPKDWNNIAPSLGFSYRVPWLDRPTVVRGGYGISYTGQATFLQYDQGVGTQQGKTYEPTTTPLVFTQVPGSDGTGQLVEFPLLQIDNVSGINVLHDPSDPSFEFVPFGTIGLNDPIRASGSLFAYTDNRRIPYIQNFNLSVETEIAQDTNLNVSYLGTVGVALWGLEQINVPNIYAEYNGETLLDAFNTTRAGGQSPMFDAMLDGLAIPGNGVVDGVTVTGSTALRDWVETDNWIADGEVGDLAAFLTETNLVTGEYGGLLRNSGLFPENFIKTNPQFNQVDLYDNAQASNYHALQVQVTKRMSNGFSSQFSYTWSKSMGNSVTTAAVNRADQSSGTRDNRNRSLQWGLVPFHRTHAFNAHGVWNLPFGPGRAFGSGAPSTVARVIEGWSLSGILSWDSGTPIPVTTAMATLVGEDGANTPDIVGAFPRDLGEVVVNPNTGNVTFLDGYTRVATDTSVYYGANPDALEAHDNLWEIRDPNGNTVLRNPLPGTTGNMAYNWLTGPKSLQFDAAMEKSVQFSEGREFSFRVDAINLLNTPQWGNPNLDINSNNFGRITNAGGARTFTLNARIDF